MEIIITNISFISDKVSALYEICTRNMYVKYYHALTSAMAHNVKDVHAELNTK